MGTDIHACIEYRRRKGSERPAGRWLSWGSGEVPIDRDYELFGALSGQRKRREFQELIPARGIPDDLGDVAFHKNHQPILENGRSMEVMTYVRSRETVVERGKMLYAKDDRESVAGHGFSYLTLEEIHRCLAHVGLELHHRDFDFQVVVATMEKLNEEYETRLVFWYDC